MEMRRAERALAARGIAPGLYLRRHFPLAHDHQGPQSRYRLVRDARLGLAGAQSGVRSVARAGQFRCTRPAEALAFCVECRVRPMKDLRQARPDEAEKIAAFQRAAYQRNLAILGVEPMPLKADYAKILRDYEAWLYESEGKIAGVLI